MKMSEGVEQAIHSVAMLSGLSENSVLSAAAIAEFHGVSTSYLLKHLQALSGAGILETVPGPKGGYRLAKKPANITLLDVVLAVEGPAPAFRCGEIRQRGPNPVPDRYFTKPCNISATMLRAERVYRAELAKTSIADLGIQLAEIDDGPIAARSCAFLEIHERKATAR
ncbi:MAG TPA: Rrf2 family transcriptional regulator [Pararhizobium sp.]|uniref:RrF2 family transcriptional regulator n=1 Tax=Pararhizobium sp. TaxID=1977563 RepID=UPI002C94FC2A|nr:Rrf2 family transcriptional regulator [Pararhizobium sp.]HTO33245.1 Rrf2 family transcriptional regulator [Pararhizobium sp.]